MNKLALKKQLATVLFGIGIALVNSNPVAAAAPVDACSKELLLAYFPETFVSETLRKFNVPQEKQDAIVKDLASKDKEVVKLVEEKASKLTPNPLKDRSPEQRQVAVKIFRETLFEVFSTSLKANGFTDTNQIQSMLDDIQQQKAKNFAQCMEKQKSLLPSQQNNAPKANAPQSSDSDSLADADSDKSSTDTKADDSDDEEKDESKNESTEK